MHVIHKTEIVLCAVLCNNCIISVVPPGFQMVISVKARRPNTQAQRKTGNKHISVLCAASRTFGCEIRTLQSASRQTSVRFVLLIIVFNYTACQPYFEYK